VPNPPGMTSRSIGGAPAKSKCGNTPTHLSQARMRRSRHRELQVRQSQTSGHLGCAEVTLRAGRMGAVPHFHHSFDEICRVLEGIVTVLVGKDVIDVPAGGWHLRPKGVVHAYWNSATATSGAIETYVPGGHEAFMKALVELFAKSATPARADVDSLGKKYHAISAWNRLPLSFKFMWLCLPRTQAAPSACPF
jgi:mannose-6-phosphate isomerase-like protein (cupin superfamily)